MPKIVIVSSGPISSCLNTLGSHADADDIAKALRLSSSGDHFRLDAAASAPANLYASLDPSFKKLFILRDESARLLQSDFTVAWLGCLLLDMAPDGELFIETCQQQDDCPDGLVTATHLAGKLPGAGVEIVDGKWIRLRWSPTLSQDVERLETIYHRVHGKLDEFVADWLEEVGADASNPSFLDNQTALATYHFRYTLAGANIKSFFAKRLIKLHFGDRKIRGFDMAGGFGFTAAELAAAGHTYGMLDYDGKTVNVGRRFLGRRGLTARVDFHQGDVREIRKLDSGFDVMSCFEALYAIGKDVVPELFQEATKLLNDGGILVIKEGSLQESRRPDEPIYPKLFALQELIDCLTENAGSPCFYDPVTGEHIPRERLHNRSLAAFVRKNSGSASSPDEPAPVEIWPEAAIDEAERYHLELNGRAEGPDAVVLGGEASEIRKNLLNPWIVWPETSGAERYRVSIVDQTNGIDALGGNVETTQTCFQVPLTYAFTPGHSYLIKVQPKLKTGWGEWSPGQLYRVGGTPAGALLGRVGERSAKFDTKSPWSATKAGREVLAISECMSDPTEIRVALRPYFAEADGVYRELIERIRDLGYTFKATHLFTPDDLGKRLAFLRYDLHIKDIAGAYGMIDANLSLEIPADFHVTWEMTPQERAHSRDFWNLRKMMRGTDLIHFGFHTNPTRSWLVATRFNWDIAQYQDWEDSGRSTSDFAELAETGKCSLGSHEEFVAGSEYYFHAISSRFKKHFPESSTLSGHGNIMGLVRAMNQINCEKNPRAWKRLESLEINVLTTRKELYRKAGYVINHTEPFLNHPEQVGWLYDPIKNGEIEPGKWRTVEDAAKMHKSLFFYIHPSTVFRP